jgi:hypothetical protein
MSFLPTNYKAPKAQNNYMRLEEGKNKFRIVSDAIFGFEYWKEDGKPMRLKQAPIEKPKDIRLNDDGSYTIKHFWAFSVINRNDLGGVIQVLELTQPSIMRNIQDLINSEDWGDPKGYDITIARTGKGLETRYTVQPSPHKELTKEEKDLIKKTTVNLEVLFTGGNPFEDKVKIAPVDDEEVELKDIPF